MHADQWTCRYVHLVFNLWDYWHCVSGARAAFVVLPSVCRYDRCRLEAAYLSSLNDGRLRFAQTEGSLFHVSRCEVL